MEIVRTDMGRLVRCAEEHFIAQLERAGQLLAEARSLDDARRVEGFVRATLEWARRQEQISLPARNNATLLWLEARARQGEMLRQIERHGDGRPKNSPALGEFSGRPPTMRELGYRHNEAERLRHLASLPREERLRLAQEATEKQQQITQQALIDAAKKWVAVTDDEDEADAAPERTPLPPEFPFEFHNQIVTGDARELAEHLPDESIALCFCDPVYGRTEDYEWLATECERVLVEGGSLIVQCGNTRRFECEVAMRKSGLKFVDLLAEVYPYALCQLFHVKVMVGWKPYLWFSKGKRKTGWVMNRAVTRELSPAVQVGGKAYSDASKELHPWGDGEQFAAALIPKLCEEGEVIWDPFTGSGTVPVVAARLGLPFVAFEIEADTAEAARKRVAGTPKSDSPQHELEFAEVAD